MDTLCPSYILQTSANPGAAAKQAEHSKELKYKFLENRFIFVPVAIETLGVYSKKAERFISDLGERLRLATNDIRSLSFLKQRISIAIQRGNAASIIGTLPKGKGFGEIFQL